MREVGHAWPASSADSLSPSTGPSLSRLTSQDPLSKPHCWWWGDSPSVLESLGGVAAGLLGASEVLSLNLTDCVSSISQEPLLGKRTLTASGVALRVQLMSWSVEAGAGGYSRHEQETDWSWSLREGPSWSSFPLRKPESLADAGHTVNGWVDRTLDGHQSTCPPVHPSVHAPSKYCRACAMCRASLLCWEDRRYLDTPPTWSFILWKQLCVSSAGPVPGVGSFALESGLRSVCSSLLPCSQPCPGLATPLWTLVSSLHVRWVTRRGAAGHADMVPVPCEGPWGLRGDAGHPCPPEHAAFSVR